MGWELASTPTFDAWLAGLESFEQVEILAKIMLLREFGPKLSRPHADTLNGSRFPNMKELRGKTSTAQLRVAFAFDSKRMGILLVGGQKQGIGKHRFYKAFIAKADKLFKEHLNHLK